MQPEWRLAPGHFFGERQSVRQLGGFAVTESVYVPHAVLPRHAHAQAFLSFAVQGSYWETYGSRTRHCVAPIVVFHPEGETHTDQFETARGRVVSVELSPRWLDQAHAPALEEPAELRGGEPCWLMLRLRRELAAWDDASALAVEGLVLEILAAVVRRSIERDGPAPPPWLRRVRDLLHARFAEPFSADEIAAVAGVHPTHLMRTFRRAHGCTVGDYVRRLRIELASGRLASSDTSLAEIALAAGFCDQSHFTKTFKRSTGLTPAEYRKAARAR